MPQPDVFICFKNLDHHKKPTRDYDLAVEVYRFLTKKGLAVFMSEFDLPSEGISDYTKAIDEALESSRTLIVIGTSVENLNSGWVRSEWQSFVNEITSGNKPDGRVFCYLEGVELQKLPLRLRYRQCIHHGEGSLSKLYEFVSHFPRVAG
jgi:hypothetical protein